MKNKLPTFAYYFSEDSIYFKISFLLKFLLFLAISILSILNHNYLINFVIAAILLGLMLISGFFNYTKKPLFIFSGIFIFSLLWLLFSKVSGDIIYLTLPWGTFISNNTINMILIASARWLLVACAGMFFLVISSENELISFLYASKLNKKYVCAVAIAFNTVGFALKDVDITNKALQSRNYNSSKLLNRVKRPFFIGLALLITNLKRVETLHQSFVLRFKEDERASSKDK
jgi:hypothetical protein